jgi:hypothetical protein
VPSGREAALPAGPFAAARRSITVAIGAVVGVILLIRAR